MTDLPANQTLRQKDAYYSLVLAPLEYLTASLRRGDPWSGADLDPFIRRCRALVIAYDARMEELRNTES